MSVRRLIACAVAAWLLAAAPAWAAELLGQVTFNGQPVPGATVTATKGSGQDGDVIKKVTASDPQGVYRFPDLAEGTWSVTVRQLALSSHVTVTKSSMKNSDFTPGMANSDVAKGSPSALLASPISRGREVRVRSRKNL